MVDQPDHPAYVQALLRPAAFDHPATNIRLIETHISWVVLAGGYAYKVKKPLDLGFLDFSTVERRRAACEDEVRLNQRLSPEIYLGVVDITEQIDGFRIGGSGPSVEPVVQMRRLPDEGMLPSMLQRGLVDSHLVRQIAEELASFHARAGRGPDVSRFGRLDTIRANWDENFEQMRPFVPSIIQPDVNDAIRTFVGEFIAHQAPLFDERVRRGRVCDGHGDLHAANICVVEGRPRFFDCLEFNPRFRCADVAAEVAFFAMDLDHFGRADLSDDFVSAYVATSDDRGLLNLLTFYKCYRAYVRGKVRCLRLVGAPGRTAVDADRIAADAAVYMDLAWSYAGGTGTAQIVVTFGPPAGGKSTLARALASRLGLVHLSSDMTRKQLAGLRPTDRGDATINAGIYSPEMTAATYAELRRQAGRWLGRGRSVVLDATYGQASERDAIRTLAERSGSRLVLLSCQADEATIRRRLAARADDSSTVSDARLEQWPALRDAFQPPRDDENAHVIDTGGSLDQTTAQALRALRGRA
ncbi:MAG: AAA family ATPase [Dehalococcoidia bacterium]